MQASDHTTQRRRVTGVAVRRALILAAELVSVALLFFVDFGLSVYFTQGKSEMDIIIAVLATFSVAFVVTILALCRRVLSLAIAIAAAFSISAAASITSAVVGNPGLSLTEVAALGVLTIYAMQHTSIRGVYVIAGSSLLVALGIAGLRIGIEPTALLLAVLAWGCAIAAGTAARSLSGRRESAVERARRAERMELARELHDVVAHQVTGIVVQAQAAIVVAQKNPEHAGRALAAIETAGTEALAGMRRMVGTLRETTEVEDAVLTVPSRIGDVPALVERFDPSGEQVRLSIDVAAPTLPAGVGETAYRVVRESLTNVRRHSHASSTTHVSISMDDDNLRIMVRNDRVRYRPDAGSASQGFGLVGMGERVTALGGTLEAGPGEPDTWLVHVVLPTGATQ